MKARTRIKKGAPPARGKATERLPPRWYPRQMRAGRLSTVNHFYWLRGSLSGIAPAPSVSSLADKQGATRDLPPAGLLVVT